jgi:hypothetical protein
MAPQQPRPALNRAPDADLHPVSGRPLPNPIAGSAKPQPPAPDNSAEGKGKRKAQGLKGKSLKPGKGASAADAITGPAKDKYVDLGARVPKSIRKRLRSEAKAQGVDPDDLLARVLDAYLP